MAKEGKGSESSTQYSDTRHIEIPLNIENNQTTRQNPLQGTCTMDQKKSGVQISIASRGAPWEDAFESDLLATRNTVVRGGEKAKDEELRRACIKRIDLFCGSQGSRDSRNIRVSTPSHMAARTTISTKKVRKNRARGAFGQKGKVRNGVK